MPVLTLVIVFGFWLLLFALAFFVRSRSGDE